MTADRDNLSARLDDSSRCDITVLFGVPRKRYIVSFTVDRKSTMITYIEHGSKLLFVYNSSRCMLTLALLIQTVTHHVCVLLAFTYFLLHLIKG